MVATWPLILDQAYLNLIGITRTSFTLVASITRKLTNSTITLFCNVLNKCPESTPLLKSISHEPDEQRRIRKRLNLG